MYTEYWQLKEKPFENTPDPRFFYASPQHQEAFSRMLYCVRERKGAGVLSGVFGCGKTVIGQVILQELTQERYRVAYLANPRLNDVDFLRMIAFGLGSQNPPQNKADVLMHLQQLIHDNAQEGRDTVVVVDEAHAIENAEVFEELRLLLNFQWKDRFLVTLLMFGQPELAGLVERNKPFEQRVGIKARLEPLSLENCKQYILSRLTVAGALSPESFFSQEAIQVIYDSTGGIPRRINRLSDTCLLAGMAQEATSINADLVESEVRTMAG